MIVSEVPGTTRDSVDVRFELDGKSFIAIDTPGVRKAKSRQDRHRVLQHAPRPAQHPPGRRGAACSSTATQRISKVDKQLCEYIVEQYKPCIFVVNKWDQWSTSMPTEKWVRYLHDNFRHDAVRADRVHHRPDRQEREGAVEPRADAVQAIAGPRDDRPAESHAARRGASRTRRRRRTAIGSRRSTTPRRSASSRRRSCCSPTIRRLFRSPISGTCWARFATSSASAKCRSSSICGGAIRPTCATTSMADRTGENESSRGKSRRIGKRSSRAGTMRNVGVARPRSGSMLRPSVAWMPSDIGLHAAERRRDRNVRVRIGPLLLHGDQQRRSPTPRRSKSLRRRKTASASSSALQASCLRPQSVRRVPPVSVGLPADRLREIQYA